SSRAHQYASGATAAKLTANTIRPTQNELAADGVTASTAASIHAVSRSSPRGDVAASNSPPGKCACRWRAPKTGNSPAGLSERPRRADQLEPPDRAGGDPGAVDLLERRVRLLDGVRLERRRRHDRFERQRAHREVHERLRTLDVVEHVGDLVVEVEGLPLHEV